MMKRLLNVLAICAGLLFICVSSYAQPGNGEYDGIRQIIIDVAGESFTGDPCSLTQEQREEIDARVEDELGIDFGMADIPCDERGGGHNGNGGGHGGNGQMDMNRIKEIILEVAGEDFMGDPCSLTHEQREEIDERVEEELGVDFGLTDLPCDSIGGGQGNGDDHADMIRIREIVIEVAGQDFMGDPCSLTQEQREEIDARVEEEVGVELGFSDLPCDKVGGGHGNGGGHGQGNGGGQGWDDEQMAQVTAIILEVAGEDFDGNPCGLTQEQREEIDARVEEEVGLDLGFADIPCDGTGGGDDGGINPGDFHKRFMEILKDVAGDDFSGTPCDLTEEQREEIKERMKEEFGEDFVIEIECDDSMQGGWHGSGGRHHQGGGHGQGHGNGGAFFGNDDLFAIISEVIGEEFDGNPCGLTQEQREAVDARVEEELGLNPHFAEIPCDQFPDIGDNWGGGRGGDGHGRGNGNGNGGQMGDDELNRIVQEIILEVAGEDFNGDICDLTEAQREEISQRLAEELGEDCPIKIHCPGEGGDDHGGGNGGGVDVEAIRAIISEVAGDDFSGNPCDLTEAQRQEIDSRIEEELGMSIGFADFPCDGGPVRGGGTEAVINFASTKLASDAVISRGVFPNPAVGFTTVNFTSGEGNGVMKLMNSLGEVVQLQQITAVQGENSMRFEMNNAAPGAYFISVEVNGKRSDMMPVIVQ